MFLKKRYRKFVRIGRVECWRKMLRVAGDFSYFNPVAMMVFAEEMQALTPAIVIGIHMQFNCIKVIYRNPYYRRAWSSLDFGIPF